MTSSLVLPSRRGFLGLGLGLIASPAIVKFDSLMRIVPIEGERLVTITGVGGRIITLRIVEYAALDLFARGDISILNLDEFCVSSHYDVNSEKLRVITKVPPHANV